MSNGETPEAIRPLIAHGVELSKGSSNWYGDCPYCNKKEHFFVNPQTGQWDCKVCGESGNVVSFLTRLADSCANDIPRSKRLSLVKSRGLPWIAFRKHNVGWNERISQYTIPCYSETGSVRDIRKYDKTKLLSTAGCKTQLWGMNKLAKASTGSTVWLCEGEWDGIALSYLLEQVGRDNEIVVAVPGANTFKKEWAEKFSTMRVNVVYDADDAGQKGMLKVKKSINNFAKPLRFINWPNDVAKGYDIRDFVVSAFNEDDAEGAYKRLTNMLVDAPPTATNEKEEATSEFPPDMPELRDMSYEEVVETFRRQVYMTTEMEVALKLMLAVVLSNDVRSDPVWLYLVAAPGSGKTLLLSAMQASPRCVFRSTLTPASLVSGWKAGDGDPSLIPQLNGKTLVAKDFTEVLDMPTMAQDEIFSTLRGAFDGHVQKSFGNGVQRDYKDCNFSILAGVTHAIHGHKKAHLGERFLRYEMKATDKDHMDAVLNAAIAGVGSEHTREIALQHAVVCYLQRRIETLPRLSDSVRQSIMALVKLIAILRSQVVRDIRTDEISYRPQAELGTRLAKQLAKLSATLAFINEHEEAGDEEYELAYRVAFDTVGGYGLDVVRALIEELDCAGSRQDVADKIGANTITVYRRFEDLIAVGIVDKTLSEERGERGGRPAVIYRVRKEIVKLWEISKPKSMRTQKNSESSQTGKRNVFANFTKKSEQRSVRVLRRKQS